MKRIFRTLTFVAIMATTPFVLTSCGDIFGMLGDFMENMEEENDNTENDDDGNYEGDNNNPGGESVEHYSYIEISPDRVERMNFHDLCTEFSKYPREFKYNISTSEDCDWAWIDWENRYDDYEWTPLLTVEENNTGEYRQVTFAVYLGDNFICEHTIAQYPY